MNIVTTREALIRKEYPTASAQTLEFMALAFGWSVHTLRTQAARMGVKRDPTAISACKSASGYVVAQRVRDRADIAPGITLDRDREYVSACMAHGGFVRAEVVGGRTVWVKPDRRW